MAARVGVCGEEPAGRRKPAGGFCFISGTALLGAWWAYRGGFVTRLDLRVWLACFEAVARRCGARAGRQSRYTVSELAQLVGTTNERSVRRAMGRLKRAGFLEWSSTRLRVGQTSTCFPPDLALKRVHNHARRVPVPRRIVRFLARDGTRVLLATMFGHLLRCLYYRDGQCRPTGTCKAGWIATVFGVDARNVKAARRTLIAGGLLVVERRSQWFLNRHGLLATVNLDWAAARTAGASLPPCRWSAGRRSPPPIRELELLRIRNQKPPTAPAGIRSSGSEKGHPNLRHVVPADLHDAGRLAVLHEQARQCGFVNGSEADRLRFFAAAEHARAVGTRNPEGLFAATVRRRRWAFLTLADEDAARRRLAAGRIRPSAGGRARASAAPMPVGAVVAAVMSSLQAAAAGGTVAVR